MSAPTTSRDDEQRPQSTAELKESRGRSLKLLRELLSPVKGQFALMAVMVIFAQGAVVAGPAIIAWGIDVALPELLDGNSIPVLQATAMHMGAAIVGGVLPYEIGRASCRERGA